MMIMMMIRDDENFDNDGDGGGDDYDDDWQFLFLSDDFRFSTNLYGSLCVGLVNRRNRSTQSCQMQRTHVNVNILPVSFVLLQITQESIVIPVQ